jgi:hypothetical protein
LRLVDFLAILQSALPSVIPAELSCQRQGKADPDRPHRVPLSDAAVEILARIRRHRDVAADVVGDCRRGAISNGQCFTLTVDGDRVRRALASLPGVP